MNTSDYRPNLLQKALGKNYKWWKVMIFAFKSNTTYRYNSFMWLASHIIIVMSTLLIWYINYSEKANFEAEFSQVFTYFVIGESLIFNSAVQFDIGENIQDGKLITKLLRPVDCLKFYIVYSFGYQLFENLSKMVIFLTTGLIFSQFLLTPTILNFWLFLIFCLLAYFINTVIGLLVGLTAFWLTAFFGSAAFFDSLKLVFSGKFFPLDTLKFFQIITFTPFAFTFYHPMQIYLGKYSPKETFLVFLGGVFWCFFLYLLVKIAFKAGLKKNESVGL